MKRLLYKLIILSIIFIVPQIYLSYLLKNAENVDPRRQIFGKRKPDSYKYAIVGDSAFCSYYVNTKSHTLWNQLEKLIGEPVFPAALSGANPNDIINESIYMSFMLHPGSIVFIDIAPGKNWTDEKQNYKNRFIPLIGNYKSTWSTNLFTNMYLSAISTTYLWTTSGEDIRTFVYNIVRHGNKTNTDDQYYKYLDNYDRIWNRDGDYAKKRYEKFDPNNIIYSYDPIRIIAQIFKQKGIRPIFVLMPVNKFLISEYSDSNRSIILNKFDAYNNNIQAFLQQENIEYLDTTQLVPSDGFADMAHVNAKGDELIAQAIARYLTIIPSSTHLSKTRNDEHN